MNDKTNQPESSYENKTKIPEIGSLGEKKHQYSYTEIFIAHKDRVLHTFFIMEQISCTQGEMRRRKYVFELSLQL